MIQFDLSIFFQMGGEKPPTSSEPWFKRRDFGASKTRLVWVFLIDAKLPRVVLQGPSVQNGMVMRTSSNGGWSWFHKISGTAGLLKKKQ